ncbi:DUF2982 domain-containing protein [Vibrio ostreicida]|uniref:DUF2982 domain-containing protein n=1 Tax=Vibrio ostreicida TaxID=526588 RepID=UPI000970EBD5|nr:DUF2982 domain-containing protein [Vibrio ostreicida]
MQTLHLTNQPFSFTSPVAKVASFAIVVTLLSLLMLAPDWQHALLFIIGILVLMWLGQRLVLKGTVSYTLTSTHFQQHFYKGGWVVKWSNINKIGLCYYEQHGWQKPLPWIGIKLNHYSPYLESICPRITTEILLDQRALLYLGAKQHQQSERFEDMVLDSKPYRNRVGTQFSGLQAMLANRMKYQRLFFDFDIFISEQDLERPAEEFIGLARRYLAAAECEQSEMVKRP